MKKQASLGMYPMSVFGIGDVEPLDFTGRVSTGWTEISTTECFGVPLSSLVIF